MEDQVPHEDWLDDDVEADGFSLDDKRDPVKEDVALVLSRIVSSRAASRAARVARLGASLREEEPLHARVNLGHPLIAEGARELADMWEQIAVPEEALHRELEAEGGGHGAGAGFGDGSGFGDGRSLRVFAVLRARLSALPPSSEPLRVIPFGDESPEKLASAAQERFSRWSCLGPPRSLSRSSASR